MNFLTIRTSKRSWYRSSRRNRMQGMTTVELVIVVAIILIVAGFVVPNFMQTLSNVQLRSAAAEVSDLLQETRILAAKKNATYPLRFRVNGGIQQVFIDVNQDGTLDAGDPYIDLPRSIVAAAGAPTGSPQPTPYVLTGDTTSGTPYNNTNTIAFSSRGLPCNYDSSTSPPTCITPSATYFVYYFQNNKPNGWSAVVITKAGRSKVVTWNGSSWN